MPLSKDERERIGRDFNREHCLGPTDCESLLASHRELEAEVARLRDECEQRKAKAEEVADWMERQAGSIYAEHGSLATALSMTGCALRSPPLTEETRLRMDAARAAALREAGEGE